MSYLQRSAIIAELISRLRAQDGWAGATHVQKAAYLLQEMLGVPLGMHFRLYKFGPFSSGVRDELDEMEIDGFIEVQPQRPPYGPRLQRGEAAEALQARYADEVNQYDQQLDFIAHELAPLGVSDLEKLATAFFVTAEVDERDVSARAARLNEIKPHISSQEAMRAVEKIDGLIAEAPRF